MTCGICKTILDDIPNHSTGIWICKECRMTINKTTCKDCGNEISPGRLKAIPGVKYCVKCADKHDTTIHDIDKIVAKSPTSTRNGFGISE